MTPFFAIFYIAHMLLRDAKVGGNKLLQARIPSDQQNRFGGQYRLSIILSERNNMSALLHFIGHICLGTSDKKAVRVDAARRVATMADHKPGGDGANIQNVGNPMCVLSPPSLNLKNAVPKISCCSGPQPARAFFPGLCHKSAANSFNFRKIWNIIDMHGGSLHELLCAACSALTRWRAFLLTRRAHLCH